MILTIRFLFYFAFRLHSSPFLGFRFFGFRSLLLSFLLQISVSPLELSPTSIIRELNEIFFTELSSVNTYFVLLSEGNRSSVEAALRQLIFILTLIATSCLIFFFYFLCIKQFVCLKPKEQSIMWSTNISEAMQAAKSVCLTADDRFWRMLIIRNETMCWCDSGLWTKSFFFLLTAANTIIFS